MLQEMPGVMGFSFPGIVCVHVLHITWERFYHSEIIAKNNSNNSCAPARGVFVYF